MLSLQLTPELERRLEALARRTGRSTSFYALRAIERYVEDLEDAYLAKGRMERGGPTVSLEELERELGLED